MEKSNKPAKKGKDQLIADILLLQRNLEKFDGEIDVAKQQRDKLQQQFKEMTGTAYNRNEKRSVPTELQIPVGTKDPEGLMEGLRQAYC